MPITVADVMRPQPATIRPNAPLAKAMETICCDEVSELYVTDSLGRLLGILPDYELLKAELGGVPGSELVEDLMTRSLMVFPPHLDVAEAARVFRDCRYTRVAVVDGGQLVGQVTRVDVLRLLVAARIPNDGTEVAAAAGGSAAAAMPAPVFATHAIGRPS